MGNLIITRKPEQKIIIGARDVEFQIVAVRGKKVRIRVTARDDIEVHREEIFDILHGGAAEVSPA